MKVAFLAESPADEAALAILTEALLGKKPETVGLAGLRHRGWPAVKDALPSVLKNLHYQSDAEGFILVVDSNGTPHHSELHEEPNGSNEACRLCQLRGIADKVLQGVRPRTSMPSMKVAFGLAVPAIEAWLLCGKDASVTEAAWINGQKENRMPYSKEELKKSLYGTSRPSLGLETDKMKEAAIGLAQNLSTLQTLFPHGFGVLSRTVRSW